MSSSLVIKKWGDSDYQDNQDESKTKVENKTKKDPVGALVDRTDVTTVFGKSYCSASVKIRELGRRDVDVIMANDKSNRLSLEHSLSSLKIMMRANELVDGAGSLRRPIVQTPLVFRSGRFLGHILPDE
jgi:hypothetical protein